MNIFLMSVFVCPVGASIDMVQVLSMEIAKSHSRRTAFKSAASIWAGLEMAKSKRQRQKLETKSGEISNISGLGGRPTGTRDRLFHRFSFPALELPLAHCRF